MEDDGNNNSVSVLRDVSNIGVVGSNVLFLFCNLGVKAGGFVHSFSVRFSFRYNLAYTEDDDDDDEMKDDVESTTTLLFVLVVVAKSSVKNKFLALPLRGVLSAAGQLL